MGDRNQQGAAPTGPEPSQVEPGKPVSPAGAASVSSAWPASYQETFNAIAAATRIHAGSMISISVKAFYRALSYPDSPVPAPCDEPRHGGDAPAAPGRSPAGAVAEGQAPDLKSLQAENERLKAERDEFEEAIMALEAKISSLAPHGSCACSYDRPGDVCMHHSPKLAAAETALAESERSAVTLDDVRGAMWRLQFDRRAGDDLWPEILRARDARLATTPQETPDETL